MKLVIQKAEHVEAYKIRLTIQDGKTNVVNFGPFLESAQNPSTRKFLDKESFKKFRIEYGDLVWGDFELCFPIIDLYEDTISSQKLFAA